MRTVFKDKTFKDGYEQLPASIQYISMTCMSREGLWEAKYQAPGQSRVRSTTCINPFFSNPHARHVGFRSLSVVPDRPCRGCSMPVVRSRGTALRATSSGLSAHESEPSWSKLSRSDAPATHNVPIERSRTALLRQFFRAHAALTRRHAAGFRTSMSSAGAQCTLPQLHRRFRGDAGDLSQALSRRLCFQNDSELSGTLAGTLYPRLERAKGFQAERGLSVGHG
jgi:hypothetical protein